jgi:hypothetical protein
VGKKMNRFLGKTERRDEEGDRDNKRKKIWNKTKLDIHIVRDREREREREKE